MSKTLIKLVDEAILPAFLIVGLKVISIGAVNNILTLTYYYQNLGKLYYPKPLDAFLVNTFSDVFVYLGIVLGVVFLIIKLLYFSDNKTNVKLVRRLAHSHRLRFIQTSIELYQILFVWMVFLTGLTVYVIARVIAGIDNSFVIIPVLVIYLPICLVILREVEQDIIKRLEFIKGNVNS
jgi:hypothetical protein